MSFVSYATTKDSCKRASQFLKDKNLVPESAPPSDEHLALLYKFVQDSRKLVVLTGAGISTECGIPDYRSPHGAYSSGFKPITHQWALAIEKLEKKDPVSDASFGMQQRPDGDIEIDGKFWEDSFHIPSCDKCGGVLKPNVVFFGDNVPKERADKAMATVNEGDALLVLGSSLMTMSAYRLARAAYEAGSPIVLINIGPTRADNLSSLKIEACCGEVLCRLLSMGILRLPGVL